MTDFEREAKKKKTTKTKEGTVVDFFFKSLNV